MANDVQAYGIGSNIWPGLAKLMEEMGELQQVLGKVMACTGPNAIYWDGTSLVPRIQEEMADVRASIIFFCKANGLDKQFIHDRADEKLVKFRHWQYDQEVFDRSPIDRSEAMQQLEGGG